MKRIFKIMLSIAMICAITVFHVAYATPVAPVEAATVKISKSKVTLTVGKSVTLSIQNTTKTATWSSSNPKVAKVSKAGKVTAVKAGTAVITATISSKAYTCKVTVKEAVTGKSLVKDTDWMNILTEDKLGTYTTVIDNGGIWGDTQTSIAANPVVKKGKGWSFDPTTLTLTLDHFIGKGIFMTGFENGITVKLIGDNVISYGSLSGQQCAFTGGAKVILTGDGKLTLKLDDKEYGEKESGYQSLYSKGEIILEGSCTLDSTGIQAGIVCNKLTVGENCTVISRAIGDQTQSCGIIANGISVYGNLVAVAEKENANRFTNEEYPNKGISLPDGGVGIAANTFGANAVMVQGDTEKSASEVAISEYTATYPNDRYVKITNQ
jgi:hypothetical protein